MNYYLRFIVVVASPDGLEIPAEVLAQERCLTNALRSLDVFLLHAPMASCSVYMADCHEGVRPILRVKGGVWRVDASEFAKVAA